MEQNPYASPSADLFGNASGSNSDAVPQEALELLRLTKPWVRLMSVLFYIGGGFVCVVGLCIIFVGIEAGAKNIKDNANLDAGFIVGGGLFYFFLSLLFLYPAGKLRKYCAKIGALQFSRSVTDLDAALNEQRGFWKYIGIWTIIGISIALLTIVISSLAALSRGGHF